MFYNLVHKATCVIEKEQLMLNDKKEGEDANER
jgi:hypothetical protein